MTAIITFIVLLLISTALARRAFRKRGPEFDSVGEKLVFETAFGLGALGMLVFALGALQLFYLPAFVGLLLLMAALSLRELRGVILDVVSALTGLRRTKINATGIAIGGLLAVIAVLALMKTLAPPAGDDWDSLAYHLAIPKLYLQHHGIYYVPFASHSNFPFTWEMLYTLGLAFGNVALAKLFHFGAGFLLVGAVYCAGKRHFSPASGALAALIVAGIPLVAWEATTAYIDLATALYSFLVIYSLLNYSQTGDRRWAYVAGIAAGLAAGTKMTALLMLPIALVWILAAVRGFGVRRLETKSPSAILSHAEPGRSTKDERPPALGRTLATAAIVAALAIVIASPWYIKSVIYTGNPVYPFFYGAFGGANWSAEAAEIYRTDQLKFGMGRDAASFLSLPWNLTFRFARFNDFGARIPRDEFEPPYMVGSVLSHLSSIGVVFLAGLPVLLISLLRPGRHRPVLVVAFVLALAWFITMQNTRYLLPALAIAAPALAHSAEILGIRKAFTAMAAVAAAFTILLMAIFTTPSMPVVFGGQTQDDYLTRSLDIYRASHFANENLPESAGIALFGETRGFYLDREYLWAEPSHNALIPFDRMDGDPGRLLEWLKSHRMDYVLVNHGNFPDYTAEDAPEYAGMIGNAIGDGLEEVYTTDPDSPRRVSIYRIDLR